MQRIFLFAATFFLVAFNTLANQPIAKNPFAGKKLNQRMLENLSANERTPLLLGRVGSTSTAWYPDSARQYAWDQTLNQYTLQSNVHFSYNSVNELDTVSYLFDFGIGLQLLGQETINWLAPGKISDYHYFEDQGQGLEEVYRFEMKYDSQGNPQSRIHYVLDPNVNRQSRTANWMPVFGDSIQASYDGQGRVASIVFSIFDIFGGTGWLNISRSTNISYGPDGLPLTMTMEEYDPFTGGYGNPVQYAGMRWGFGFTNWSEAYGMTNPFANDFAIFPKAELFLMQPTDFVATQAGINYSRSVASMQNNRVQQMTQDLWVNGSWASDTRFDVVYQGAELQQLIEMAPNTTGWDSINRSFFSYNSNGYLLEAHEAGYDASLGWQISDGVRYAYSFSNNKPETVETNFWDGSTGAFEKGRLIEYVFVPGSAASTPSLQLLEVSAWPNPTEGELKLRLGTQFQGEKAAARVFSTNGQLMLQQNFNAAETASEFNLSLTQLPAGMYLVQFTTDHAQQSLRIVKR